MNNWTFRRLKQTKDFPSKLRGISMPISWAGETSICLLLEAELNCFLPLSRRSSAGRAVHSQETACEYQSAPRRSAPTPAGWTSDLSRLRPGWACARDFSRLSKGFHQMLIYWLARCLASDLEVGSRRTADWSRPCRNSLLAAYLFGHPSSRPLLQTWLNHFFWTKSKFSGLTHLEFCGFLSRMAALFRF